MLGESMGAYVAVVLAAERPEKVERLVLMDGGLPIPLPPALGDKPDLDAVITASLGPALARLSTIYKNRHDYLDFWRAHPALKNDWDADIETYLDYDLKPVDGGFRSRVQQEAVRADSRDVINAAAVAAALKSVRCDIALVTAPRDLLDRPSPLLPVEVVADWQAKLPNLSAQAVEDVNHYTLMFGPRGVETITALLSAHISSGRWPTRSARRPAAIHDHRRARYEAGIGTAQVADHGCHLFGFDQALNGRFAEQDGPTSPGGTLSWSPPAARRPGRPPPMPPMSPGPKSGINNLSFGP